MRSAAAPKGAFICLAVLARLAAAAPLPGIKSEPVPESRESRLIIRYGENLAGPAHRQKLESKTQQLQASGFVTSAHVLSHMGMTIVKCETDGAVERLMEELENDPDVDLAVPDSQVWLLASSPFRRASAGVDGKKEDREVTKVTHFVALRTLAGRYLSVHGNGSVTASSNALGAAETFEVLSHEDGTSSLKSLSRRIAGLDEAGIFSATNVLEMRQRFVFVHNGDGTTSFKCHSGLYLATSASGVVAATEKSINAAAKFMLENVGSPQERFPDDPLFRKLWGLRHHNKYDVAATAAWNTFTGELSSGIIVGVVDTGIDYTHEDLHEQMWVNRLEIPDNGIDDDGNGFVDDIYGADFVNNDGDPMDDAMHGTHCAGTIAAIGNNGVGVVGVAWRGVRLMALKFLSGEGGGQTSDAIRAIDYAVAHGAKILSNSWGGGGSSSALRVAIERAEQAGVLFVVAAGNSATNNDERPQYPANYPVHNIVTVASTTVKGDLSSFSCYGKATVSVAAPGSGIYSTVPGNKYKSLSGTSMACPHVSGLAALVWMYRPSLTLQQLKDAILESVVKEPMYEDLVSTGGRVSVQNALLAVKKFEAPRPPQNLPRGLEFADTDSTIGAITGIANITAAANESDIGYYRLYYVSRSGFPLEAVATVNATGEQTLQAQVSSSLGVPRFAVGLIAVAGNATGESPIRLDGTLPFVPLVDLGIPLAEPRGITWGGDWDIRPGMVAGVVSVLRALDESTITHYNVYWRNGWTRGPLLGSVSAIGFKNLVCAGKACDDIQQTEIQGGYRFDHKDYGSDESAYISLKGPTQVVVTCFDTEDIFDFLKVGNVKLSGRPSKGSLPMVLDFPEEKDILILWASDASITSSGWTIEVFLPRSTAELQINTTEMLGTDLEVVAAYHSSEGVEAGLSVAVQDLRTGLPPSGAFLPVELSFMDEDRQPDVVAGVLALLPALEATGDAVTLYRVQFADADGQPLGECWTLEAPDTSTSDNHNRALDVDIPATPVPSGAVQLVARAGNHYGMTDRWVSVPLIDAVGNETLRRSSWRSTARERLHLEQELQRMRASEQLSELEAESLTSQPWLQPVAWPIGPSVWEAPTMLAAGESFGSSVLGAVTIVGLDAQAASVSNVRNVLGRTLEVALSNVNHRVRVRLVRIANSVQTLRDYALQPRPAKDQVVASTFEFEAAPRDNPSARASDVLEAKLLLLAHDELAVARLAGQFRLALAASTEPWQLAISMSFAEPRQVWPQMVSRRLEAGEMVEMVPVSASGSFPTWFTTCLSSAFGTVLLVAVLLLLPRTCRLGRDGSS